MSDDVVTNLIKIFFINIFMFYTYVVLSDKKYKHKDFLIFILLDIVITMFWVELKKYNNSFYIAIIVVIIYSVYFYIIYKNKVKYSIILICISYAFCIICQAISIIISFICYKLLPIENNLVSLFIILIFQFLLLFFLLKNNRIRNGFNYIYNKLNDEFAEIIIINICIILITYACIMGSINVDIETLKNRLVFSMLVLSFTMFLLIKKTLTMYYKQKLMQDELKYLEDEVKEKDKEIERLSTEKFNVSKIAHKFHNRQKALEMLVKQSVEIGDGNNEELLKRISELSEEYIGEFDKIKELPKLDKTNIKEIDDLLKYMQSECDKNKIHFKLKVECEIYQLINNIIPKNKLETLIGDHLRDAINATKLDEVENKEILLIIGIKDNKYELNFFDTGIDFEINTLVKLGQEAVTTNSKTGGSGIGFLTTFETMEETGASLIITENPLDNIRLYTKCITIRFDEKKQYKIKSYRINEIKKENNGRKIVFEKIRNPKIKVNIDS